MPHLSFQLLVALQSAGQPCVGFHQHRPVQLVRSWRVSGPHSPLRRLFDKLLRCSQHLLHVHSHWERWRGVVSFAILVDFAPVTFFTVATSCGPSTAAGAGTGAGAGAGARSRHTNQCQVQLAQGLVVLQQALWRRHNNNSNSNSK